MEKINKKSVVGFTIMLLFILLVLMYCKMIIPGEYERFRIIAIGLMGLLLVSYVLVYMAIYVWKWKIETVYLVEAFVMGIVMLIMIPVYSAPDEPVHISTAYSLSNKMMNIPDNEDGTINMRRGDYEVTLKNIGINRDYYEEYFSLLNDEMNDSTLIKTDHVAIETEKYPYIFSAIGITMGRLLHLGTLPTYLLARLLNMMFFIGVMWICIRKIPIGKTIVMTLALMPMSLQQASSISYDSFIIPLAFLVTSMTIYICYGAKDGIKVTDYVITIFAAALLFPLKQKAYFAIGLFPILILVRKREIIKEIVLSYKKEYEKRYKIIRAVMAVFLVLVLIATAYGISRFITGGGLNQKRYILWADADAYSIMEIAADPINLFKMIGTTLYSYLYFYERGFVGTALGCFEIGIPETLGTLYLILLAITTLKKEEIMIGMKMKLAMNGFVIISLICIFAGMLLGWTPMGLGYIEGVQGRYFIPISLIPLITFNGIKVRDGQNTDQNVMMCIMLLFVMVYAGLLLRG